MLVFRFGKTFGRVDSREARLVFDLDAGVSDAAPDADRDAGAEPVAADGGTERAAGTDGVPEPLTPQQIADAKKAAEAAADEAEAQVAAVEAEANHSEGEAETAVESKAEFASLKAGVEVAKMQAKMGEDFTKLIELFDGKEVAGAIKMSDLNADLTFKPELKKKIQTDIGASLQKLTEQDWAKVKAYFDPHYETGTLEEFRATFIPMMAGVGVAGLEAQVKAMPNIAQYDGFTKNGAAIEFKIKGLTVEAAMQDASGHYAKFVEEKGGEAKAKTEKEEMIAAIKKNGGPIGALIIAIGNTVRDKTTGETWFDQLAAGKLPHFSFLLGLRGVEYGPFKDLAQNIKEAAGQDPRTAGWLGKIEGMVGKGKEALKAETVSLFESAKQLLPDGFETWISGKKPLEDMVALADGYTGENPVAFRIPKGEKLRFPAKSTYEIALGKGNPLTQTTVGDDPAIIEAPKVSALTIIAKALPPKTILPKGATVVDIA